MLPARSTHSMAPQKRNSSQSSGGSSSSSIRWSTTPPSRTKQCLAEYLTLPDGTTAYRVPAPRHSHDRTIPFSDGPGISIKDILKGGSIQDSPEFDFKAGSRKIVLQWPGYDSLDITINSNTKQELAVALCTALHKFYSLASVGDTFKTGFLPELTESAENTACDRICPLGPRFTIPLGRYHAQVYILERWCMGSGVLCTPEVVVLMDSLSRNHVYYTNYYLYNATHDIQLQVVLL
ncbi:hypothetical protein CY34DRAFT_711587 [Suillus luteus UH-Slu-Lm8-n1]|uniref:Uncharacterized protein n=1 Tax=Suillus luteus UH-Slu-Lm8-n1 TaxID=930992 RepID=A0A0D0AN09_9AGAM|nr:hypothetical protein CY34DRAFT_711587 [Suillus luteus UH-Slu-Lm8-n1]